jgi:hypothetical protein
MFKKVTLFIVILICLAGCNLSDSGVIKEDPFIRGEVTEGRDGNVHDSILVEENPNVNEPSEFGGGKIWLTITNKTKIYTRTDDGSYNKTNAETLAVGQQVEAWVRGPIDESDPMQGAAKQIVVIQEE